MDDVGWSVLIIAVLTAVSLFFSLNNLSLRTFSRVKLQDAFKNAGKEKLFEDFIDNAEDIILACSFFRIITNIGILILLAVLFAEKHYLIIFIVAVIIFEIFNLAVPHSWSKHTGENILARNCRLLKLLADITAPILFVFKFHDRFVKRLAGVADTTLEQEQDQKQEEILSIVEQGQMEGVVDKEEMEMIENVLELGDTTAEEIMTPRTDVVAVSVNDSLQNILDTISKAGHSRIPVYEDKIDNIIGLLYAKDLLAQIGKNTEDFDINKMMRKPYFVPETKLLTDLLHEFQNQKLHIAVVLDEYGGTAGIVTIEDILEELVGEIADEYEQAPPQAVKKIDDTTIEIDARMYIDDLNNEFDMTLPEEEDYDTVGGFVFSHLGYIPKTGHIFEYENIKFTITAAETRKIKRIKIEKIITKEQAKP